MIAEYINCILGPRLGAGDQRSHIGGEAVAVDRFIEAILARKVAAPKRRQEAGRSSRPASGILFQDGVGTTHARSGGTQATRAVRHRGASEPDNIRQFDGGVSNCNALKL
jgi:hypothetical protein